MPFFWLGPESLSAFGVGESTMSPFIVGNANASAMKAKMAMQMRRWRDDEGKDDDEEKE